MKNNEIKSDGIRNLGRVIGQEYFVVGMRYTEGKHYNVEIQVDSKTRKKYAYKFGNFSEDIQLDSGNSKSNGEISIILKMLSLTKEAVQNQQLMTPEVSNITTPNPNRHS